MDPIPFFGVLKHGLLQLEIHSTVLVSELESNDRDFHLRPFLINSRLEP